FLYVNRDRRQADYLELVGAGRDTARTMLWEGVFERLPRASNRAGFGDRRNYLYKGEIVDNQSHLGVDLASTARSPVPAGNTGIVVLAGTVGIYGETVMLDHGYGLYSSYSHLSQISVTKGQTVKKGEIVGVSGSTGLAGGDHLHFAVMVHDSFVDPKEWWDPSWIKNNITSKIRAVEESLIPAPGPVPE
ncbi:MAG: M23 family metallopeptidase, partial [Pseudomonadota bacterium]